VVDLSVFKLYKYHLSDQKNSEERKIIVKLWFSIFRHTLLKLCKNWVFYFNVEIVLPELMIHP
jgi:hypothetical protein